MSTETADGLSSHGRSLVVTATATLGGVAAGVASAEVAAGPNDRVALIVLAAVVVAELIVMRLAGVDVSDFSTKDNLYVLFMSFSMWFVAWTILLTTQ